jgi:hypothetical protein
MFRATSRLTTVSLTVLAATVITACGSSSVASSAAGGRPSPSLTQGRVVAYSRCMRTHGVPDFPDPTTSPHGFKIVINPGTAHSPGFTSAEQACRHLLPQGGQPSPPPAPSQTQLAGILAFARCIRAHGFPSFPDPTGTGEITHEMIDRAGINLHQPAVLRAADACIPLTHGLLTRADVAHFIAGH